MTRRLAESQVVAIRERWAAGEVKQRSLATEHGVSVSTIWRVVHALDWVKAGGPIMPRGFRSCAAPHRRRSAAEAGPCSGCGRAMVQPRAYNKDPSGWRTRGFVRLSSWGRCSACYQKALRSGAPIPRPAPVLVPSQKVRKPRARQRRPVVPLSPAEVVRLRRMVGLPDVLPVDGAA